MGLGKWWLKHGPGSPGTIAKTIVRSFAALESSNPDMTREELFRRVLAVRYSLVRRISPEMQEEIVKDAHGSLVDLVMATAIAERFDDWTTSSVLVREMAQEVVAEVVAEEMPEEAAL